MLTSQTSCFSFVYKQTGSKPDIPKCEVLCLATLVDTTDEDMSIVTQRNDRGCAGIPVSRTELAWSKLLRTVVYLTLGNWA